MNMKFLLTLIGLACAAPSFAQFNQRPGAQQTCTTPERYYGTCVALSYCPQVVNVFQTTNQHSARQYVIALQRSCGTRNINGDPVVCCTRPTSPFFPTRGPPFTQVTNPFLTTRPTEAPRPATTPSTTTTTTTSTTTTTTTTPPPPPPPPTPAPTKAPVIDNRSPQCRGPDLRDGSCVALEACPELINELYAKQNDPTFANFLRASNRICGSTGSTVCCPSGTAPQPTTASPIKLPDSSGVPRQLPTVEQGCGYTPSSYRKIVGGKVTRKGAWPWIALIGYDDDLSSNPFKCGGTLVTARHVVTAAHCIRNDLAFVRLGEHDLQTDAETQHVDIPVVRKEAHPQYNTRNGRSDIAILYLQRNVQFTELISPVCLPIAPELRKKSYVNYTPFVIGWGKTMEGGPSSSVLQELQIPIFENIVCRDSYEKQKRLFSADQFDSAIICAGDRAGGKDTCQGDSGGPLMIPEPYQNSARFYLIGVVSYGIGCARPDVPGVYTSTQYFIDWIIQKVADTS